MTLLEKKELLDDALELYYNRAFIEHDPISIPHSFEHPKDIEIAGFFAALFAWGNRKTIINKSVDLLDRMDNTPYEYVTQANTSSLASLTSFKHRTFNGEDILGIVKTLQSIYAKYDSLEDALIVEDQNRQVNIKDNLHKLHLLFAQSPYVAKRTMRHIASPYKKAACKRLVMYFRWMVRKDKSKVDFGLWTRIKSHQLECPLDVHVARIARDLGLLHRKANDWHAVEELGLALRAMDANDPIKYDYALFSLGLESSQLNT